MSEQRRNGCSNNPLYKADIPDAWEHLPEKNIRPTPPPPPPPPSKEQGKSN
ncbi:hypothetical protein J6Z61_005485 [Salmonella enterica subsp. enterica serovar Newport]|nr:hypothetical protein [Salmonella enterica subsp. enterica serovar Newport]